MTAIRSFFSFFSGRTPSFLSSTADCRAISRLCGNVFGTLYSVSGFSSRYGCSNNPRANFSSSTRRTALSSVSSETSPRSTASSRCGKLSSHRLTSTPAFKAYAPFAALSLPVSIPRRSIATPSAITMPSKPSSSRSTSFKSHSFAWHGTPSISLYAAITPVAPAFTASFIAGR